MDILEKIKLQVSKELGFKNYSDMYFANNLSQQERVLKYISTLYAKQCVKASLDKASENVEVCINWGFGDYEIDKESITDSKNIVLL